MSEITPAQKKKLQKIAQVVEHGNVAIVGHIFELEEKIDEAIAEVKASVPNIKDVLEQVRGKDGESIKGEKGDDGEDGYTPIKGQDYFDGKDGQSIVGPQGKDGKDGVDGETPDTEAIVLEVLDHIPTPENGKDGSPDTPEQVVEKVNVATVKIKSSQVEGLDDVARIAKNNQQNTAVPVTTTFFSKNGALIGRAKNINFIEGNNMSLNAYLTGDTLNISYTSTATGSGNFATEETPSGTIDGANVTFTLAHTPVAGSVKLYLNGARQQGGGGDYSISGSTITFNVAPLAGSILLSDYQF